MFKFYTVVESLNTTVFPYQIVNTLQQDVRGSQTVHHKLFDYY